MANRIVTRRPQRSTRQPTWIGAGLTATTVSSGATVIVGVLNAAALALRPFTVVRTRISMLYESDQAAVSERPQGAFGAVVVQDQASAAGAASVPGPISEADADWFIYQGLISSFIFLDSTSILNDGNLYEVDSKAMRKVGTNEDVVLMVENRASLGSVITLEGRMLVKLH